MINLFIVLHFFPLPSFTFLQPQQPLLLLIDSEIFPGIYKIKFKTGTLLAITRVVKVMIELIFVIQERICDLICRAQEMWVDVAV